MWRQGEAPQYSKNATIVYLYKCKGNRQLWDNHRDISLPNIAGKTIARILLNRPKKHVELGPRPERQCRLRCHRGTTDMIFTAYQLQEKCQEMWTHLYSTFVDLTKDFETVSREGLGKSAQKFDRPEPFTQMVRQFHNAMMARVTDNGAVSEAFAVTHAVKQCSAVTPTLFSLRFSVILMDAYRDERPGLRVVYRMDGGLLNQQRMHFQSRVSTTVHELLLTDDCTLNATTEGDMQRNMHFFAAVCDNFDLIIDTEKTVVMHQPPPNTGYKAPQISVTGTQVQVADNITYLSSTLSRSAEVDEEVSRSIFRASQAFGRL
nr:unnamed protein product [Spirometra erinaceieuropaei]